MLCSAKFDRIEAENECGMSRLCIGSKYYGIGQNI